MYVHIYIHIYIYISIYIYICMYTCIHVYSPYIHVYIHKFSPWSVGKRLQISHQKVCVRDRFEVSGGVGWPCTVGSLKSLVRPKVLLSQFTRNPRFD